jgi:hypothetical protein
LIAVGAGREWGSPDRTRKLSETGGYEANTAAVLKRRNERRITTVPEKLMPQEEWSTDVQGHAIRVTNSWMGGAKLYIDGEWRDINKKMIADPSKPALSARLLQGNSESALVEVFMKAMFTVKAEICVDGKQVVGDVL